MNYTVHWTDDALDELAAVWTDASDRNAVTAASHRLEQDLAREPYTRGVRRTISDEKIERRRQQYRGGKPLSEIMKRLQGEQS